MIGYESRHLAAEEHGSSQFGLAAVAFIISILLHFGLVLGLSSVNFFFTNWDLVDKRPKPRAFELMDVKREPIPEIPRPAFAHPGDPTLPSDLPKQADAMGVKPDDVAVEPPPLPEDRLAGELGITAQPSAAPKRNQWEPRQEILEIEKQVVADRGGALGRKRIPKLDRVSSAPDFVLPADRDRMLPSDMAPSGREVAQYRPSRVDIAGTTAGGGEGWGRLAKPAPLVIDTPRTNIPPELAKEVPIDTKGFRAIEKYLTAELTVYTSLLEPAYGYFRLEIKRIGPDVLPVIPKDVLLVQDCSASMTDQRLYFCTNGLVRCLDEIGPQDRFNIVSFREQASMCFPQWAANSPDNVEAAKRYIGEIRSSGNTDIYSSLQELLKVDPVRGRPVIALLLSDGHPTAGLVKSSDIIGEFSKVNNGRISIFSMGTIQTANSYLLDLLSYCNRGDSFIVRSGRYDIPKYAQGLAREVSRPVLSDVRFYFAGGKAMEVVPVLTANLYLDRPLVLFGRYPKSDTKQVIFQAVGKAGEVDCDMVFNLPLDRAKSGEKDIRTEWAKQRIYSLIAKYAREPSQAILDEIAATARVYKIDIPYRGRFDR